MPSTKIPGYGFDVCGDRKKRMDTGKKTVRQKQRGVIVLIPVLGVFLLA